MNLAPPLLSLLVIVSCARASAVHVGEAPVALRAALADTARLSRIYFAGEVVKPVAPREGNEPPYVAGLPDGEAQARVVVGPDGRVDTATAYLLPGSAHALGAPLVRVLGGWRFYPAELSDGAKVRQLVVVRLVKRGNGIVIDVNPVPRRCVYVGGLHCSAATTSRTRDSQIAHLVEAVRPTILSACRRQGAGWHGT